MKRKAKLKSYTFSVSRRKSCSARVRIFKGDGVSLVNGKAIEEYFCDPLSKKRWLLPFQLTETEGKYYITVKIKGGGKAGQIDAVVTGIAKALSKVSDGKYRKVLKKAGLLTTDSRVRERRKVGTGGKARRKKQSPKR